MPLMPLTHVFLLVLLKSVAAAPVNFTQKASLTPFNSTSSFAWATLVNSTPSASNIIVNSAWQCTQPGGSQCVYLTIRDDCDRSSRVKIGIFGGLINGVVDLFSVFSYVLPDHSGRFFTLLSDWDGTVTIPEAYITGGVFIAPSCGMNAFEAGNDTNEPNGAEGIFGLLDLYDASTTREGVYLALSNGDFNNFERLTSETERVGNESPLWITLENDRVLGKTEVYFEGGMIGARVGCDLNESIPGGSELIINFFSDEPQSTVAFDKFEVEYTCDGVLGVSQESAVPSSVPSTEPTTEPSVGDGGDGFDFYLLLDLSDSLTNDTNALMLRMAEVFLFGGIEASWRDLYGSMAKFCLLGYNDVTVILENCTNNPVFLQTYYENNTDGDIGNDVDIMDFIGKSTDSKMASAMYQTVSWILDGAILGASQGGTRVLMTTLQTGIEAAEADICEKFAINDALEYNQINHVLVQLESVLDGKTIGNDEIAPLRCLINSEDEFVLNTYYSFDINLTPLETIESNMQTIAASFANLYSLQSEEETTGYITFQTVRTEPLPTCISGAAFAQIQGILWLVNGDAGLGCKPNETSSLAPTQAVPAPTSTPSVDANECNVERDGLLVAWEDIIINSGTDPFDSSSIETEQVWISDESEDAKEFALLVTVRSKYFVEAEYESLAGSETFGFTYVLDTNEFGGADRLLQQPNPCENRLASSFDMKSFDDYWEYTLNPSDQTQLGNDNYLQYPQPNSWNLTNVGEFGTCDLVQWRALLTLDDIVNKCRDSEDRPSYSVTETSDEIVLGINFYLIGLSPNPLAIGTDSYLTHTIILKPVHLAFAKIGAVLGRLGEFGLLAAFRNQILATSFFIENAADAGSERIVNRGEFEITLITSVPAFMVLQESSAATLTPSIAEIEDQNFGLSVDSLSILEVTDDYSSEGCLILTDERCFQLFAIVIDFSLNSTCPSAGLVFDGNYSFGADIECTDASQEHLCQALRSDSSPLDVTLESAELRYRQLCDADLYVIDWDQSATMNFYEDESFSQSVQNTSVSVGDVVYTRLKLDPDVSFYEVLEFHIDLCWFCTADKDVADGIRSCFDAAVDVENFYILTHDADLQFEPIGTDGTDSGAARTSEFSFVVPALSSDGEEKVIFVDCRLELTIHTSNGQIERRRMVQDLEETGNVLTRVVGAGLAVAQTSEAGSVENLESLIVWIGLGGGVALLLCVAMRKTVKTLYGASISEIQMNDIVGE